MESELIVLAVLCIILFGSSAIPKLARSIGQAKSEFEKGLKEGRLGGQKEEKHPEPQA